jgi:hypothetical protein
MFAPLKLTPAAEYIDGRLFSVAGITPPANLVGSCDAALKVVP